MCNNLFCEHFDANDIDGDMPPQGGAPVVGAEGEEYFSDTMLPVNPDSYDTDLDYAIAFIGWYDNVASTEERSMRSVQEELAKCLPVAEIEGPEMTYDMWLEDQADKHQEEWDEAQEGVEPPTYNGYAW